MKVRITFELSDTDLAALADRFGLDKMTRDRVETWVIGLVDATMDDVRYEYENGRARPDDDDE